MWPANLAEMALNQQIALSSLQRTDDQNTTHHPHLIGANLNSLTFKYIIF